MGIFKTFKAFTDIEQSEKLAEILPIESADMWFHPYPNDEYWYDVPNIGNADLKYNQLPCWSLAALIGLLPNGTVLKKSDNGRYFIGGLLYDNLLDVCVDKIIELKERNLT